MESSWKCSLYTSWSYFTAGYDAPPNVIPSTINKSSVAISGTWDDFTITWDASTEVKYGNVLYEISVVADSGETFNEVLSVSRKR